VKRRLALAGLIGLPASVLAAGAEPAMPAKAQRRLRDGMGLNVKFGQGQPLRDLPMLTELGVTWVRDYVPWRLLEPQAGRRESGPAAWRERLGFYRQHDIGIVFLLVMQNEVAYPATETEPDRAIDPEAFGEFALSVAKLLRQSGVRFVLEIGNEPHNGFLHKKLGGDWSGRPPAAWLDHYLRMTAAAVARVKAFDPAIRLLSDDDMWITHYRYLDAGLPPALDGFAVHPYDPHGPEITTGPDADWMRPHRIADDDHALGSAVRRLRARGQDKLAHRPEIWFTEWGWPVGTPAPRFVTEELQAARLPRAFIVAEAAGVEATCWFSSDDAGEGSYGLLARGGRRRPAYEAFRTLSRELGDWTFESQVIGADHPTQGLQGFLFRSGSQIKLALWNADERQRAVTLSGPLRHAQATDMHGHPLPGTDAPGQGETARTWVIDGKVLYLGGLEPPTTPQGWADHVK
jgi:hypothetical protein